ncbi:mRNA interferase [Shewanella sairae]|uniref:mRNA interferase n=1 Tax=Shewanella sairae TaxID=190310 RepID=A0ABQ4PQU4_9GAMM|nr:type II toxin-antitoxin system PemK/MazF family toxin [Shewanella sairae]MCL1132337.1 type II toxin-antitoxin system PemK/MazF family toxin [Shewanella sairae]GIU51496.1 mRNA interferase [Shewanella sairae]
MVNQFDVVLIDLNPTVGAEINKTRPCVVISPDDVNKHLKTVIIAPLTSTPRGWSFRPVVQGSKVKSEVAIDQMRAIDKNRIIKKLGQLTQAESKVVSGVVREFFE